MNRNKHLEYYAAGFIFAPYSFHYSGIFYRLINLIIGRSFFVPISYISFWQADLYRAKIQKRSQLIDSIEILALWTAHNYGTAMIKRNYTPLSRMESLFFVIKNLFTFIRFLIILKCRKKAVISTTHYLECLLIT